MARLFVVGIFLLSTSSASSAHADEKLCMVVHPGNPNADISLKQVADLFARESEFFPDGNRAEPVDLSFELAPTELFYKTVLGKNLSQLRRFRAKVLFEKNLQPPRQMESVDKLIAFVAQTPDAIGFVPESAIKTASNIKPLTINGHPCW